MQGDPSSALGRSVVSTSAFGLHDCLFSLLRAQSYTQPGTARAGPLWPLVWSGNLNIPVLVNSMKYRQRFRMGALRLAVLLRDNPNSLWKWEPLAPRVYRLTTLRCR